MHQFKIFAGTGGNINVLHHLFWSDSPGLLTKGKKVKKRDDYEEIIKSITHHIGREQVIEEISEPLSPFLSCLFNSSDIKKQDSCTFWPSPVPSFPFPPSHSPRFTILEQLHCMP
jgi:hypothetical protein